MSLDVCCIKYNLCSIIWMDMCLMTIFLEVLTYVPFDLSDSHAPPPTLQKPINTQALLGINSKLASS